MKLATVKGFKDYLPIEALKRLFVVDKIKTVFAKFGFEPLETPTLEYAELLTGKYGEEERLIFEFITRGGDKVALKYDQTVPLARVIAENPQLPKPFKRYQIQPAFRGENPQKGRLRELLQCDADIIGSSSLLSDAEILAVAYEIYHSLGVDIILKVSDRSLLSSFEPKYLSTIDKLNKIGQEAVLAELVNKGLSTAEASSTLEKIRQIKPNANIETAAQLFTKMGYPGNIIQFDPTLIRGLDYYTGIILEAVLKSNPTSLSLGGGGRWDKLIGQFTGADTPAVGFSVGLDRTINTLDDQGLLKVPDTSTKILVTVFSETLLNNSLELTNQLRQAGINSEIWLTSDSKLDKQLKYADLKKIPYVAIIGPDEASKNIVTLKNLFTEQQETLTSKQVISKLSS